VAAEVWEIGVGDGKRLLMQRCLFSKCMVDQWQPGSGGWSLLILLGIGRREAPEFLSLAFAASTGLALR
jgi:hypothetical protein